MAAIAAATFISCSDDENNTNLAGIPAEAQATVSAQYPNTRAHWETQNSMYKATLHNGNKEVEMWFDLTGAWQRTETDYHGTVPAAIQEYIALHHGGYVIDEIDLVSTVWGEFYEVELDHPTLEDISLYIDASGTVIAVDQDLSASGAPANAAQFVAKDYPNARVEWESEHGMVKAELTYLGKDVEVWFQPDGTWLMTQTECRDALPAAVQAYLAANYAGYSIDDVDWVQTPSQQYYNIELEKKGMPNAEVNVSIEGLPI